MALVYLTIAWLAGILVAERVGGLWWAWLALGGAALIGLGLARKSATWRLACGLTLAFALGAARYSAGVPHFDADDLATYNDSGFVTVEGLIVDAPDPRDTHVNLRVRAEKLALDDAPAFDVSGLALVQAPRVGVYRYGDPLRVIGQIETPPVFEDFSYRDYLARQGVHSTIRYAQVEVIGERRGSPIRRATLDFRTHAAEVIARLLPDPEASLLAGILLGDESGIAPDVRDDFNATGATHIIAISGANLAILAGVLMGVANRLVKPTPAAVVTIVGIFVYSAFVGGDAAVVRAAIMATLGIVAARLRRQTFALASLAFAALAMTAVNPFTLWDAGFLLSFLATLGLVLYTQPLEALLERGLALVLPGQAAARVVGFISEAFIVTVAAQITTTPIIALLFGRLSLVSLPVNFLIVPAQAPLMILGGLAVLVALIAWPVGQLIAWIDWLFLAYTVEVVRLFARLPFASFNVDISPPVVWLVYGLMFGLTAVAAQPEEERKGWWERFRRLLGVKALAAAGLLLSALALVAAISAPDGRLHVWFLDVGDGQAALIQTPSGRHILVDAGGSGRALRSGLGEAMPFWARRLDLVILTRSGESTTGGLADALRRYRAEAIIFDGVRGDSDVERALWAELDAEGVPLVAASAGTQVRVEDGVTLGVLGSQDGPLALMLTYGDTRILLAGSLGEEDQAALIAGEGLLNAAVLQIPTRSAESETGAAFVAAVGPQIAVGSGGAETYNPARDGTIHIISDGRRVWARTR
jgi:competence protein ComEC